MHIDSDPMSPANSPSDQKMGARAQSAETPSGKGAKDENFPVGSFLLPKHLRPHVATYYDFARAIDDVADNPELSSQEKIQRLRNFDAVLKGEAQLPGYEKAIALRTSMMAMNVPICHGSNLIVAFIQDAEQSRYKDWSGLIGYCENSANPVGRYLLDLHGEDSAGYQKSDALCTVLQILNHIQDCGDDLLEMDRCYIPTDWLNEQGSTVDDVRMKKTSQGLRIVMDRMLDGCDKLMTEARQLPPVLKSRHLAMESEVIIRLAARLLKKLRNGDPLATRVALTKIDFALAGLGGCIFGFLRAGSKIEQKHQEREA